MLIVEDGSIVAGANSCVTVAEIKSYAAARGFDLPCTDSAIEINAILAMDYLQSKCYQGEEVDYGVQALLWPRKYVYINNTLFDYKSIPQQLKNAQIELTIAQANVNVMNNGTDNGIDVKREKTDMIETEYFEGGRSTVFQSQRVNSYLRQLIKPVSVCRI